MSAAASELKCRCASAYSSETARFLLGDTFHPGGAELTDGLLAALDLAPSARLVDVSCGLGVTAVRVARRYGRRAVGIDLSAESLAEARMRAAGDGVAERAAFVQGDAEALPLRDGVADAVVCECALCTFPDQPAAVREMLRVLRPGGRVGLAEVVADPTHLPKSLLTLDARIACVAGARPLPDLVMLLADAGLAVERAERHDDALVALLERVQARLRLARTLDPSRVDEVSAGLELVAEAKAAVARGALGYAIVVGHRR